MASPGLATDVPARTRTKIRRRILPFIFLLYIVSYLDRANVAYAKLPMTADLGFSEAVFGFGAGIFFIGYLVLEIPGALIVERWSARKWISRILLTWGLCTLVMGFVHTSRGFYAARFLLGCAEAGFFPGIIVYLSHWFTRRDRARAMAGFITAIPVSLTLGAPVSALILKLSWFGMAGWRWIFVLEGAPAILLGIVTLFYLTDHPRQANWLRPEEREWIETELEAEKQEKRARGHVTIWQGLRQRNVLLLALALCSANIGGYTYNFWLPSIIRQTSHLSVRLSTAFAALPPLLGIGTVLLSGYISDRTGERRLQAASLLIVEAVFFALSTVPGQGFPLVMFWLCLTAAAGSGFPPPFWVLPTATLGESAAAASIGLINSIGNLGGFIGPSVVGFLLSRQFTYTTAILFLSTSYLVAGILILNVKVKRDSPA